MDAKIKWSLVAVAVGLVCSAGWQFFREYVKLNQRSQQKRNPWDGL